jgi:hypothetical protein
MNPLMFAVILGLAVSGVFVGSTTSAQEPSRDDVRLNILCANKMWVGMPDSSGDNVHLRPGIPQPDPCANLALDLARDTINEALLRKNFRAATAATVKVFGKIAKLAGIPLAEAIEIASLALASDSQDEFETKLGEWAVGQGGKAAGGRITSDPVYEFASKIVGKTIAKKLYQDLYSQARGLQEGTVRFPYKTQYCTIDLALTVKPPRPEAKGEIRLYVSGD